MRVWLFKDGEFLPVEKSSRRMRTGMLAEELRRRGHEVHWFTSTFLHVPKQRYSTTDQCLEVVPNLWLHLLDAGQFKHNLSIGRYRFYQRYARRVCDYCVHQPAPDVIVCSFPLIDVAAFAVAFARKRSIPVIVDVRDLWPDTIVDMFPRMLRPVATRLLRQDFHKTRYALETATCLSAMSKGVLQWGLGYAGRNSTPRDRVIPIGYPRIEPCEREQPSMRMRALLDQIRGRRVFTYVGAFGHTYDFTTIVGAAREFVAAGRDDIVFLLVGRGPLYDKVRRSTKSLPNVLLGEWFGAEDIRHLLARTHVGLLPWNTIDNAMPNKFFDYLAAGRPVLSSAEGELNDLIVEEGIGVPYRKGNEGEFIRGVIRLCDDLSYLNGATQRAARLFKRRFQEDVVYGIFADYVEGIADSEHGQEAVRG